MKKFITHLKRYFNILKNSWNLLRLLAVYFALNPLMTGAEIREETKKLIFPEVCRWALSQEAEEMKANMTPGRN